MRCIINVSIGGRYPRQQKLLEASLKKHFHGDFLGWTEFPNDNYNRANPYNAKAAAFEEAIKKGYKQILWLDSPVIALKAVAPIFDSIAANGYLTIKNHNYNCAQTCSDACLAYFKVTRDEAEKFQEHAGGVIGIDMDNTIGRKLIERFIEACKAGACDGSRKHDGQSSDPRFKYHRQCQSVISLAANTLGLKPTMEWDTSLIGLYASRKTADTILCWSSRGKDRLEIPGNYTRRATRARQGPPTRKNNAAIAPEQESYIYIRPNSGLNDCLTQLAACTKYAVEHKRSIILEMPVYSATDLDSVFDFSRFPVPVYTNFKEKAAELADAPIEPACIQSLRGHIDYSIQKSDGWHNKHGELLRFDLKKSYPSDTVLVDAASGGGGGDDAVNVLSHIRLKPGVIAAYHRKLEELNIPAHYISIHIRATDRKLNITNNIAGIPFKKSNAIIKAPSTGNQHKDSLRKIGAFIESYPLPVFVAGDNPRLIAKLERKYPSIIALEGRPLPSSRAPLHWRGSSDPENLRNAMVDLLILAGAKAIMTSAGGYSRLAKKLLERKEILAQLLASA